MRDFPYLLILLCLVSGVLSVILLVAWRSLGRAAHALTWSLSYAVGAVLYLINSVGQAYGTKGPLYSII
jgi:hypothetical protein